MPSRRSLLPQLLAATAFAVGFLPDIRGAAQPDRTAAPEFIGIDGWINTSAPLALTGLRGKVVLVNFWTYSCINCRRTVPYLNRWQAEYGARGLQVVGIHTPEFGFEHTRHNVADAVGVQLGKPLRGPALAAPVAQCAVRRWIPSSGPCRGGGLPASRRWLRSPCGRRCCRHHR